MLILSCAMRWAKILSLRGTKTLLKTSCYRYSPAIIHSTIPRTNIRLWLQSSNMAYDHPAHQMIGVTLGDWRMKYGIWWMNAGPQRRRNVPLPVKLSPDCELCPINLRWITDRLMTTTCCSRLSFCISKWTTFFLPSSILYSLRICNTALAFFRSWAVGEFFTILFTVYNM